MSRRHKKEEHSLAEGELNLVPYLDIIVNLNMFMLLTFQVVLELKVINFNPPASGSDTTIGKQTEEDKTLVLTVLVKKSGHAITTTADAGAKEIPKTSCKPGPLNPSCVGGLDYDYAGLQKELEALRKNPEIKVDVDNLIVVAEPDITYDYVVATLDSARCMSTETPAVKNNYCKSGFDVLFPHVTLGLAVGSQ